MVVVHVADTVHRVDEVDVAVTVQTVSIGQVCSIIPVSMLPKNYTIYCS